MFNFEEERLIRTLEYLSSIFSEQEKILKSTSAIV